MGTSALVISAMACAEVSTSGVNFELNAVNVLMNEAVKLSQDKLVIDLVTKGVHIGIMDKHSMSFGPEFGGVGYLRSKTANILQMLS